MTKYKNEVKFAGEILSMHKTKKSTLLMSVSDGQNNISVYVPDEEQSDFIRNNYSEGDLISFVGYFKASLFEKDHKVMTCYNVLFEDFNPYVEGYYNHFNVSGIVVNQIDYYNCKSILLSIKNDQGYYEEIPFVLFFDESATDFEKFCEVGSYVSYAGKIQTSVKFDQETGVKRYYKNHVINIKETLRKQEQSVCV